MYQLYKIVHYITFLFIRRFFEFIFDNINLGHLYVIEPYNVLELFMSITLYQSPYYKLNVIF